MTRERTTSSEDTAQTRLRTAENSKVGFRSLSNMDVSDTKRIVLLGKTGSGKSSLANTIFGEEVFQISHSPISESSPSRGETRSVEGRNLTLIDAHSVFYTCGSEIQRISGREEKSKKEILRCITECAPGPHSFLIVLKVEKFTQQEKDVIKEIYEQFSEDALKFAAVVFTFGDQLPDGWRIEDFVQHNEELNMLVRNCGGRCHVVDNKYWKCNTGDNYRNNVIQVAEILRTIDNISEANDGMYYTNEMLQAVKHHIQIEEAKITKSTNQSPKESRDKAKNTVLNVLMRWLVGTTTGAVLGAFLGMVEHVKSFVGALGVSDVPLQASVAQSTQFVPKAALSGGLQGAWLGYCAAAKAKTVGDAFQKATKAVFDNSAISDLSVTNEKQEKDSNSKGKSGTN